jgi:hypothetical protein
MYDTTHGYGINTQKVYLGTCGFLSFLSHCLLPKIFLTAPPSLEPQYIVNQLKGYTSRILGQEHKWLRGRLPTLWTRSYYIGSVGTFSASTVEKYIENHKGV